MHLGSLDVLRQKDEVGKTLGYLPQEFGGEYCVGVRHHVAASLDLPGTYMRGDSGRALFIRDTCADWRRRSFGMGRISRRINDLAPSLKKSDSEPHLCACLYCLSASGAG